MTTTRKSSTKKADAGEDQIGESVHQDAVAVVNRGDDGEPLQSDNFVVLLPEGAPDADKAAAWNNGGEMPPESRIRYFKLPV